ncbi:hypothetical protein RRG08_044171 [Elysia crispata]|uniref:Uncharacterized protein n=1 Tax=Elysia crispata TaxID=231223 RepID=A0AAE0XWS3_9GAST|nr:hypothetical protein RRG08_044171 [Elysia crispata]
MFTPSISSCSDFSDVSLVSRDFRGSRDLILSNKIGFPHTPSFVPCQITQNILGYQYSPNFCRDLCSVKRNCPSPRAVQGSDAANNPVPIFVGLTTQL